MQFLFGRNPTRWTLVLLRPREVVVRRLALRGAHPIRGVMSDWQSAGTAPAA